MTAILSAAYTEFSRLFRRLDHVAPTEVGFLPDADPTRPWEDFIVLPLTMGSLRVGTWRYIAEPFWLDHYIGPQIRDIVVTRFEHYKAVPTYSGRDFLLVTVRCHNKEVVQLRIAWTCGACHGWRSEAAYGKIIRQPYSVNPASYRQILDIAVEPPMPLIYLILLTFTVNEAASVNDTFKYQCAWFPNMVASVFAEMKNHPGGTNQELLSMEENDALDNIRERYLACVKEFKEKLDSVLAEEARIRKQAETNSSTPLSD